MADAHRRKKNPEEVRRLLIASAVSLATNEGVHAVSVEAVARLAGVTRGALFHHFENKHALIAAVFRHLLEAFEAEMDALMSPDPVPYGRFTRAYVKLAFADTGGPSALALWMSTFADPELRLAWADWLRDKIASYGDLEKDVDLEVARYAADGVWFGFMMNLGPSDIAAMHNRLDQLTTRE